MHSLRILSVAKSRLSGRSYVPPEASEMKSKSATFNVTLSAPAADSHDEATRRLRAFLKSALRCYGLRCVRCRAETTEGSERQEDDSEAIR